MSYRSYVGAPLTGYTNEAYGYPQTYMANDILALQTLYGANFTTHQENTVYSWSSTTGQEFINGVAQLAPGGGTGGSANRIFETVWDGNGIDTYDLSNYTTAVSINLNPGASSVTSATQIAYLGNGHYAAGNIYNAYLVNNDARSYIDNAIGGSGNDTLIGNAIANTLDGGSGNDTLTGGGGNDTIIGGSGTDIVVFSGNRANYLVSYNSATQTFTVADQRAGSPDGTDTVTGVENFQFTDGTFASSTFTAPPNSAPNTPVTHDQTVASGTSVALSTLFTGLTDPDSGDSVTHVWVSDRSTGGGHLTLNGVVQNDNQAYGPIPISQLSQWAFLAGGTDTIAFQTVDSHGAFSAGAFATVTASAPAPNNAPNTPVGHSETVASGTSVALSALFTGPVGSSDAFVFAAGLGKDASASESPSLAPVPSDVAGIAIFGGEAITIFLSGRLIQVTSCCRMTQRRTHFIINSAISTLFDPLTVTGV
jgi:Peptidase M10 serralysin C terminal